MIRLTRTTGERCRLDPAVVERVEADLDTVAYLTDGTRHVVTESIEQVVAEVRAHRAAVLVGAWRLIDTPTHRAEITGAAVVPQGWNPRLPG